MKNCGPTITPTVDNESNACSECGFFDFSCITIDVAIPYIGVLAGDTLLSVLNKFLKDYKKKSKRIKDLETALAALTLRVEALEEA